MRDRLVRLSAIAVVPLSAAALALSGAPASSASTIAALTCRAHMTNSRPADFTTTDVRVRTAKFARIRTRAHYRTTTTTHHGAANSRGRATIAYDISGATPGFRVRVSVKVKSGGRTGYCHTFFRPHA